MSDCQLVFNSPDMYLILGTCLKILHHLSHALFIVFSLSCLSSHFLRRNFPVLVLLLLLVPQNLLNFLSLYLSFIFGCTFCFRYQKFPTRKLTKLGRNLKLALFTSKILSILIACSHFSACCYHRGN